MGPLVALVGSHHLLEELGEVFLPPEVCLVGVQVDPLGVVEVVEVGEVVEVVEGVFLIYQVFPTPLLLYLFITPPPHINSHPS